MSFPEHPNGNALCLPSTVAHLARVAQQLAWDVTAACLLPQKNKPKHALLKNLEKKKGGSEIALVPPFFVFGLAGDPEWTGPLNRRYADNLTTSISSYIIVVAKIC